MRVGVWTILLIIVLLMIVLMLAGGGEYGGVIMIGPIPIVFGSNYKWAVFAMILTLILMSVAFIWMYLLTREAKYRIKHMAEYTHPEPTPEPAYEKYHEEDKRDMNESKVEYGGVIMIGPIPIVFGSNYKWAVFAMILTLILMSVAFIWMYSY